jgi:16S rRNA (guanine527-N7)-methyltransferase
VTGDLQGLADEAAGKPLTERQLRQLATYRDLIAETARKFSLTAVRDPTEIERRHIAESLAFGRLLVSLGAMRAEAGFRVLDVGTGAGLPGIPMKIAWPEISLSLLEANAKRCIFLRDAVAQLLLDDAIVLEGRAEAWARAPDHRQAYDLVVARAVAPLRILLEYTLPFLKRGGYLAAPKGTAAARETAEANNALRELGGNVETAAAFQPPDGVAQTVIFVRKTGPTPDRYPRRPGVASKRPL